MRIAIAGATGYVGGRLAPRLLDAGHSLRCLVREPRKLEDREWSNDPRVEIRQIDLRNRTALVTELEGCTDAYYLVHSMLSAEENFAEKDLALAKTFAEASKD